VLLSLDVPDIFRAEPDGICWPLTGIVILTPCDIKDNSNCDVDAFEVTFVLLVEFTELILDALDRAVEFRLAGCREPSEGTFV
jgi:hypothetical protein